MTVTTRRERRQQERRQQQRKSSGGGGGSRRINQLWIVLGIVAAVILLIGVARAAGVLSAPTAPKTDVNAVDVSGPKIGTHFDNTGNAHIPTGQKANYAQIPPTSGEHWAQPAAPAPWGIKTAWLQFEVTTHNLEHGGIVIMYNGLSATETGNLTTLVRSLNSSGFNKIVLEPWPDMPKDSKIIVTAWDWMLKLAAPDDTSVVKFVRQHTDDEAPENGIP
jgi:Protein of unknown function (DUF3105)